MDTDTDCGSGKATHPDMALGSSPVLDVTMAPEGKQDSHRSPFLSTLTSTDLPFSTVQ